MSGPAPSRTTPEAYVAVYFEHKGRLVPEYRGITGVDAPRQLWDLLVEGPRDDDLTTALGPGDQLLQVAEPDEGRLLLEVGDAFWSRPPAEVYRAAAQIVYSMGNLEEGREVILVDGLGPGVVKTPNGESIDQPLTREDFPGPLVQIAQPVAGAVVGPIIPVDLILTPERRVTVSLEVDDAPVAAATIRSGTGRLVVEDDVQGPARFVVELTPDVTISVPLELRAP